MCARSASLCLTLALVGSAASAQWDPNNAQWGKTDSRDIRVMTYNIRDTICSSSTTKTEGQTDWSALARIVAAMKPDVLIMQEVGDNSGNGTGSGVDSVSVLTTTLNLWLHGGNDPFRAGNPPVTAWVQKYAATYDLPFIYVSDQTDNFNRNVILSRFPFTDQNGDGRSTYGTHFVAADLYAPGGNLGIRGYAFAEMNLPNAQYGGELVVANAHLRCCGEASDLAERLTAGKNTAYLIDYWYNGGGTSTPDPRGRIADAPAATRILDPLTPVIMGGDLNEDENLNGRDGPVLWISRAAGTGDGTDRDRSDSLYEDSRDFFSPATRTTQSNSKLDYLIWQDSIATLRRSFLFNSSTVPLAKMPAELLGLPAPVTATTLASDHRPVIADFILPLPPLPGGFALGTPVNGAVNVSLTTAFSWGVSANFGAYELTIATDAAFSNVIYTSPAIVGLSHTPPSGTLAGCQTYFWTVSASNAAGTTPAAAAFSFSTPRPADFNRDGTVDFFDYLDFVDAFSQLEPSADFNADGGVDFFDYLDFVDAYASGC